MLSQDLKFDQDIPEVKQDLDAEDRKVKFGRSRTVTAMTKNLIYDGERDPKIIIQKTLAAIEAGEIKKPKSAFIFYSILKQAIIETLFKGDPEIKTYKDVVRIHGDSYRFSPKMIADLDKNHTLPSKSETDLHTNQNSTVIKIKLTQRS